MSHPFEKTLGLGPYRFVGMFTINIATGQLASLPHPTEYMASQGKTLADYAQYILKQNCNAVYALPRIQSMLKGQS